MDRAVVLTTPRLAVAETRDLVDAYMGQQTEQGWTKWRLADAQGVMIGRAGFGDSPDHRGLSYLIRRSHWRRGLATEVAAALVDWHVSQVPGLPLTAIAAVENLASIRVLQKVGFEDEAHRVDYEGVMCRSFRHPRPQRPSPKSPS